MQTVLFFMYLTFHLYHYKKNMFCSKKDLNNLEYLYQSVIQIWIQNTLTHPLTLVKGPIGYAQQDVSLNDYQTTKYRITHRIHGCLHLELFYTPNIRNIKNTLLFKPH